MKTTTHYLVAGTLALTLAAGLIAQEAEPPAAPPETPAGDSPAPSAKDAKREAKKAERKAERKADKAANVVKAPASENAATPSVVVAPAAAKPKAAPAEEAKLRLNFRGVPLDMVLNYLSEAAGYIIILETPVKGSVDVWSNDPLTKSEAIDLLNTVLNKNGYAAVVNGRSLTVVSKDEAKKRTLPVVKGSEPESIPKTDEMVTQILPVKYIAASQLIRDLQPLLPTSAVITANDGGNSLVITDTRASIRRVAEIVAALDTAQAGNSGIRVFPLKFADAKALATTIRELFQDVGRNTGSSTSSSRTSRSSSGGPGGGPGGGGDPRAMFAQMIASRAGGGSSGAGPVASTRVTAVADEHSNSLIVSASEDMIPTIEAVIAAVDTDVQDLTELRVFTLRYSDPTEMAQLLNDLFSSQTGSSQGGSGTAGRITFGGGFPGGPFGGGGFPGGGPGRTTRTGSGGNSSESERQKQQSQVVAVADPRTSSVVVTAAKELMPQIAEMVLQLDSNPARKQKVFVYSLENANVQEVETVLRSLFETQNTRGTTTGNQMDALQNRANQASQQQGITSGFGGTGGGGLGGGGGFR